MLRRLLSPLGLVPAGDLAALQAERDAVLLVFGPRRPGDTLIDCVSRALVERDRQVAEARSEAAAARTEATAARMNYRSAVDQLAAAQARELDLADAAEEANSRIAVLERLLRAHEIDPNGTFEEQLALVHAPAIDAEPGGEMPIAEDPVITDKVQEYPLRLVGVFFDRGPGRPHSWVFSYGKERGIKVPIRDADFLERVRKGDESFRADDVLIADVRVITRRGADGGPYPEYVSIDKVHRVDRMPEDAELPFAAVPQEGVNADAAR